MAKKLGFGLMGVIVLFLGYVALQPQDYAISREITIQATAEKIFPYLNNAQLAGSWGPWLEIDPGVAMTYSGPGEGVGAKTSWENGKKLGTGSATVVESIPNQKVGVKLEYTQPMVMTQDSEYLIASSGTQSVVTWRVRGRNSFMGKLMCSFGNMDKMVGGMFEKGLAKLKAVIEKS